MRFVPAIKDIKTYEAGKPIELVVRDYGVDPKDVIKLASNENPYGTPQPVVEALKGSAHNAFRYPDDSMFELKSSLGAKFGVGEKNIIIGSGSDQVIEIAIRAKCGVSSKILTSKTTFAMYEIYAKHVGAEVVKTASSEHKIEEFKEAIKKDKFDIIFLCLPNNPLGECLDRDDVYSFLEEVDEDTLVVVDGAYQEYAKRKDSKKSIDPKDLIERFKNTIYLGTFSKAYGLGGMRVGYGIGREEIIEVFYKLRAPFNITTLSLVAASVALKCEEFVDFSVARCFEEMERYEKFANDLGFEFIESYTNFITYKFDNIDSSDFAQWLLQRGVIVRNLASYGVNGIRVTIGKSGENDSFFKKAKEYLELQDSI